MYTIKPLPEFDAWFDSPKDPATRARLSRRLEEAERGLQGELARTLRINEEDQS